MRIEVRKALPGEAGALTELSFRSKRSNGYDEAFMEACREELTVTPQRMEAGEYWVAIADRICGCACLLTDTETASGEVHAFFIDPHYQRRGIGQRLWGEIRRSAKAKGLATLKLDADPFATAFYERLGFVTTGQSPSGSIPDRMLPRMELSLT